MLSLNGKKVLLLVIAHFGHILTAMGQACNSGDPVTVCRNAIRSGTSFFMDFHVAIQYTSCSCNVSFTQNDTLYILPKLIPGVNCGMSVEMINMRTAQKILYGCTTFSGTSVMVSPSDPQYIEISKNDGIFSHNSNFCIQIRSENHKTFTLSCAGNGTETSSSKATLTPELSPEASSTSSYMSTTSVEVPSSSTNPSVSTTITSNTDVTAPETVTTPDNKDDAEKSELGIIVVAGAAGGGGALLVVICIVVIVCYRRSRTKQNDEHITGGLKNDHNHLYDNDASIPVDDNYDLTDNVLYNSGFIPDQEVSEIPKNKNNNKNTGYEDPEVVRTNRQNLSHMYSTPVSVQPEGTDKGDNSAREDKEITPDSKNDESSIPIYAVSNKKKKINENENCEIPVYAMPMKKKNTNSREIPSTKPKPAVAKKPSKPSERRVNDDGLCYADLQITNSVRNETRSSLNNNNESDVQYADVRI